MILGIGTDVVEVDRIKQKVEKGNEFKNLVFSEREIAYCESLKNSFESYAARFATKEAFLKAIGLGLLIDFDLKEIEIINLPSGQPELNFTENVKNKIRNIFKTDSFKIHISFGERPFVFNDLVERSSLDIRLHKKIK